MGWALVSKKLCVLPAVNADLLLNKSREHSLMPSHSKLAKCTGVDLQAR